MVGALKLFGHPRVNLFYPPVIACPMRVRLISSTTAPASLAVASARSCYSSRIHTPGKVNEGLRDRLGREIFTAGHHTPFQHPAFIFALEGISRHAVWSFLHAHPFYNSEQSSQRYVHLKPGNYHVPVGLTGDLRRDFEAAVDRSFEQYERISELLESPLRAKVAALGRKKGMSDEDIDRETRKKAQETARYVVPVACHTSMYHTLSGLQVLRYLQAAGKGDCAHETRALARMMVEVVKGSDEGDAFLAFLEEPGGLDHLEGGDTGSEDDPPLPRPDPEFAKRFDQRMGERSSLMVDHTRDAEAMVADSLRDVLGLTRESMADPDAIDLIMDPSRNHLWGATLNSWYHAPEMRPLHNVHYTFIKRISHCGDSQDQRHRMTPASRPVLSRTVPLEVPDVILPEILKVSPEAREAVDAVIGDLWNARRALVDSGAPRVDADYLLPNATAIRYTQSGELIHYVHKWRMRTCFNAQEEIYRNAMDELEQVRDIHPLLVRHVGPPCAMRRGWDGNGGPEGPCPEGPRWCGIPVWKNFPSVRRVL